MKTEYLEIPEILRPSHLPSLDGLRGVSIIIVVLSHTFRFAGIFGVDIFFVISGFLITTLLLREKSKSGSISLSKFYIRRALRILPVAFLYLAVLSLINLVLPLRDITYEDFLSAILFLRNTSIIPAHNIYTAHYWSLSVEEQFYIVFPFLLVWSITLFRYTITALIVIIPVIGYAYLNPSDIISIGDHLYEFTMYLPGVMIGSLASVLIFSRAIKPDQVVKHKSYYSLVLLITAMMIRFEMFPFISAAAITTLTSFLIACMIVLNLREGQDDFFFKFVNNRYLVYLGVLSYSIYIWQTIFTYNTLWKGVLPEPLRIMINLLLLALTSYCSYYFFERRFLLLKEKFK